MCPQCGGIVFVIAQDHFDGTLYECEVCGAKSDHTELIAEGPEAEALREKHEAEIGEGQYQAWLALKREDSLAIEAIAAIIDGERDAVESAGGVE